MFIGVCGSSSSGKTTISELLKAEYEKQNNKCFIISLDMFYKNTPDYSIEDREHKEYCLSSENMSKPFDRSGPNQQYEAEMDSRIPCKHCGRKFNEEAAKRHIPLCANKARQMNMANKLRR